MSHDNHSYIISSPEGLGKYLKIANPLIWFLTILIIIVLSGFIIWGINGSIDSSIFSGAISDNGNTFFYVGENNIANISEGMTVKINGTTGKVSHIPELPIKVFGNNDLYALHISGIDENDWVYAVEVDIKVPNGIYEAEIVTKSEKPISFVIN